jgi:hypothetical protein
MYKLRRGEKTMKKSVVYLVSMLCCVLLFGGCTSNPEQSSQTSEHSRQNEIPFGEEQLYAVAYLGYQQMDDLDYYVEQYLDSDQLPIHYLSGGDYYLVIPRYSGTKLSLYQNDMETMQSSLIYEEPDCQPFILQCNVSDIFADATICLTYQNQTAEFSPFISLKDGSLDVGAYGLNITKPDSND